LTLINNHPLHFLKNLSKPPRALPIPPNMRCSFPVSVRPLPISQIPLSSLRLPPRPTPLPNLQSASPTLSKLLSKLSTPSTSAEQELPEDGRGLGGFTLRKQGKGGSVPGNLRVEEYVEKRREFEGVSKRHRDLVRSIAIFPFSLADQSERY